MATSFQRFPAVKMSIQRLINGQFVPGTEQEGSYIKLNTGEQVFRCNIMGTVLQIEEVGSLTNILLDDGTGQILIRSFEPLPHLKQLSIGTPLLLIGRIRKYNEERYISPEIVKPISPAWLEVRSKEIIFTNPIENKAVEDENFQEEDEEPLLPVEKLLLLIRNLDSGDGVSIEEVIERSSLNDTEQLIEKMLERGDIFQIQPGKIKVL